MLTGAAPAVADSRQKPLRSSPATFSAGFAGALAGMSVLDRTSTAESPGTVIVSEPRTSAGLPSSVVHVVAPLAVATVTRVAEVPALKNPTYSRRADAS